MTNIYQIVVFLISSVSMLSGLIDAPFGAILFPLLLISNYSQINFRRLLAQKIELIFFAWLFISCLWSISGIVAFTKFNNLFFFFIATILATDPIYYEKLDKYKNFAFPLVLGCLGAIMLFVIEYKTDGIITRKFRTLFQAQDRHFFVLYFLDRGCSILSLFSWAVIFILAKHRKWILAILYTLLVAYILKLSDSTASFLAFVLGILTFVVLYASRMYLIYLMMIGVILGAIIMPIFAVSQNPLQLSLTYPEAPDSGKHRLFIWKYTADKAMQKPIVGWGFNSARTIPIDEENEVIHFKDYIWSPLPLHPHNNFMQIWLECGIIGLVLFTGLLLRILFKIMKISQRNSDMLWGVCAGSCFVNYLFIAMISFGMWQSWWIATIALVVLFFNIFQDTAINKSSKV